MKAVYKFVLCFLSILSCFSCQQPTSLSSSDTQNNIEFTIAVIFPHDSDKNIRKHYEQTINLFFSNYNHAQQILEKKIKFSCEYYDESTVNLEQLGATLANRQDIVGIIGPVASDNVNTIANACQNTKKPLKTNNEKDRPTGRSF